jgi:hypothetical protein
MNTPRQPNARPSMALFLGQRSNAVTSHAPPPSFVAVALPRLKCYWPAVRLSGQFISQALLTSLSFSQSVGLVSVVSLPVQATAMLAAGVSVSAISQELSYPSARIAVGNSVHWDSLATPM